MGLHPKLRTSSWLTAGLAPILLGLVLYVVGRPFDGFVGGLFQGSSVMLLLIGVFVIGQSLWGGRREDDREADDGGWWLPSREAGTTDADLPTRGPDDA